MFSFLKVVFIYIDGVVYDVAVSQSVKHLHNIEFKINGFFRT